jgi:hypothetical protein
VLTVSRSEMGLELCPSFLHEMLFIQPATCAHEVSSCKYFGVATSDFLRVSNDEAACLLTICTLLNLLEQGFNRLLGIPCSAHVFKVDFKINRSDVAVSAEEVINMSLAEILAKPTMLSFKTSKYMGSNKLMICF